MPRFDLMQVHNLVNWPDHLRTMRRDRDAGLVRYIGITTSREAQYEEFEKVMRNETLDFIQINYSLGEREAEDRDHLDNRERGPHARLLPAREFADAELAPYVAEWDEAAVLPVDAVHKMGDLGLFALPFPEETGGMGGDFTSLCVAIEEIGRVDQSLGITLEAGVGLGINPIFTYGTERQRDELLPDLMAGRALAGFGLTEAEAGSDAGATRTKAELDGDEWVINGEKWFASHARFSEFLLVMVVTNTERPIHEGASIILVEKDTPGFDAPEIHRKFSLRASVTSSLFFDNVRVPAENMLPEVKGLKGPLSCLTQARYGIAWGVVGAAMAKG